VEVDDDFRVEIILFILVFGEIPQLVDYVRGPHLECYECHSNRPGCGKELDWILMRWKRCDMPSAKCVKIIERVGCMYNYFFLNFVRLI
jgi:hypothetical protein